MKAFIDNKLIRLLTAVEPKIEKESILEVCKNAALLSDEQSPQFMFRWTSLLEYLDLGWLFEALPVFDEQNKLFFTMLSVLALEGQENLVIELYDQIFVECLTQIKNLPQIDQTFLIQQIQKKRQAAIGSPMHELFSASLDLYEKLLKEDPYNALHDLTLSLAWDRVCVNLALLFEYPSHSEQVQNRLGVLTSCLIESFQHITAQKRTVPSFFRLIEALYAYQMRQENLQKYSDDEWLTLCQSSKALRPRQALGDVFYIDAAIVEEEMLLAVYTPSNKLKGLTLDSVEQVQATLTFARYMIENLKASMPDWHYALRPAEVVCLYENQQQLQISQIIGNNS